MYELLIHWDDKPTEVAVRGTHQEVLDAMPHIATTIDPDKAVWELKWQPAVTDLEVILPFVNSQMGNYKNGH